MTNRINVRIIAADSQTVSVIPENEQKDCPRCQAGQGCGNRPWFRGLFQKNTALTLPMPDNQFHAGESAVMTLQPYTVNQLAMLTYAVPLAVFIITLWFARVIEHELLQLLLAILAMASAFLLSRYYTARLIKRQIQLEPAESVQPNVCTPQSSQAN